MGLLVAELLQDVDNLVDVVGEVEQQVLVFAGLHQALHQGIDGDFLGPKVLAQENHRAGEAVGQVMVLHRFLEDFLQDACAARGIDGATKGQSEDMVLAQAVFKVFGNVGGKRG